MNRDRENREIRKTVMLNESEAERLENVRFEGRFRSEGEILREGIELVERRVRAKASQSQ